MTSEKLKFVKIMGYVGIFRKSKMKNVHFLKISQLVQIGGEI